MATEEVKSILRELFESTARSDDDLLRLKTVLKKNGLIPLTCGQTIADTQAGLRRVMRDAGDPEAAAQAEELHMALEERRFTTARRPKP